MSKFEQWIEFDPAYDCITRQPCKFGSDRCKPGSGGSHGRCSVKMYMYLRGPLGVVQFWIFTGWNLDDAPYSKVGSEPLAADLGYHSPKPLWDGQEAYARDDCHLLPGQTCYYGGSGLQAEVPFRLLREEGSEAVWSYLRQYYRDVFEAEPAA